MKRCDRYTMRSCLGIIVTAGMLSFSCSKADNNSDTAGFDSTSGTTGTDVDTWVHEWTPYSDMPDCEHVEVVEDCEDGWCRIPNGCFVMGSPEDEWARSPFLEDQLTVILDQSFEIMQYEVTLKQWHEMGFPTPERHPGDVMTQPECLEDNCPVDNISWWDAVAFANKLSGQEGLTACYSTEGCSGEVGTQAYACESVATTATSLYECEGYRLPTEAEWEHAARAGTQTSYYAGPSQPSESTGECSYQPYLVDIAWYCYNSEDHLHPVGEKLPNNWGLYDMLGSQAEWTNDVGNVPLPVGPVHNLNSELLDASLRTFRGGLYYAFPPIVTASKRIGVSFGPNSKITGYGIRLVRTVPD